VGDINLSKLPMDDQATYRELASLKNTGGTLNINQKKQLDLLNTKAAYLAGSSVIERDNTVSANYSDGITGKAITDVKAQKEVDSLIYEMETKTEDNTNASKKQQDEKARDVNKQIMNLVRENAANNSDSDFGDDEDGYHEASASEMQQLHAFNTAQKLKTGQGGSLADLNFVESTPSILDNPSYSNVDRKTSKLVDEVKEQVPETSIEDYQTAMSNLTRSSGDADINDVMTVEKWEKENPTKYQAAQVALTNIKSGQGGSLEDLEAIEKYEFSELSYDEQYKQKVEALSRGTGGTAADLRFIEDYEESKTTTEERYQNALKSISSEDGGGFASLDIIEDYEATHAPSEARYNSAIDRLSDGSGGTEEDLKLIEEYEESHMTDEMRYNQALSAISRGDGGSMADMEVVENYEATHGLGMTNDLWNAMNDSIANAEAMTEYQNKRAKSEPYDADIIEKECTEESELINKYTDPNKGTPKVAFEKRKRSDTFKAPNFLSKGSSVLLKSSNGLLVDGHKLTNYKLSSDPIKRPIPLDKNKVPAHDSYGLNKEYYGKMLGDVFKQSGFGGLDNQFSSWMKRIDRYQLNMLPPNTETSDITLMTRPCLPMNSMSIKHDSFLRQFDTDRTNSVSFAIRCLLDKFWASTGSNVDLAHKSPLYDPRSPWITPVTNGLVSISGFPDPQIETKTTEGGYHQEDQTYVKGGTGMYRSQQLQLNFKDPQGGPLMLLFQVWIEIMAQLRDGRMMSYLDPINRNYLPYAVGIYHFNLDPTKTYITNWAKCTMCFPLTVPIGAVMNKSENQRFITSAGQFTIPFMCNFIHYNKMNHLRSFNILTERYCKGVKSLPNLPNGRHNNYEGIPYIEASEFGFKLVYKKLS